MTLKMLGKMKIMLVCILCNVIIFTAVPSRGIAASSNINVVVDGRSLKCDTAPIMTDGKILVPLRSIFEALGASVEWEGKSGKITGTKDKTVVVLYVGQKTATVNGKSVELEVPAKMISGSIMVPTRFVAESLGQSVKWDAAKKTVIIGYESYDPLNTGGIKGVITWQYNYYVGTKPDVDSKIALIPINLKKSMDNSDFSLLIQQISQGENGIFTAVADGYGNYEISDVPAGNYYILIVSCNTNRNKNDEVLEKIYSLQLSWLKEIFSDSDWNNLNNKLQFSKFILDVVEIKKDKIITISNDFGY